MEKQKRINFFSLMIKVDRCAAWTLLVVLVLYAITGFGMTKGLINREFATSLHLGWLGAVGLLALVIHPGWAIYLAFRRWRIWNIYSKVFLISFLLLAVFGFGYLQFFYKSTNLQAKNYPVQTTSTNMNNSEISQTIFTTETLSKYNGLNNQPAYVAVDGLVYDVSSLFINGVHHGCLAGQEVSNEFHQAHSLGILKNFKVLGNFKTN